MKYLIASYIVLFFSFNGVAQANYTEGMQKALQFWGEGKTAEAVALFERISQVDSEAWLPCYYSANVHIASSFSEKDESLRNEMLEQAKKYIQIAHARSEDNAEIITLEGLLYTAYVAADPGNFAMKYAPKIMELHDRALSLDPINPRALMNKVEFEMGTAQFFNEDMSPYCQRVKKILSTFDEYESSEPFAPRYGKERLIQLIENCNE